MKCLLVFLFLTQTALASRLSTWAYNNVSQYAYVKNSRLIMGPCNTRWESYDRDQSVPLPPEMKENSSLSIFPFGTDGRETGVVYQSSSRSINLAVYSCIDRYLYGPHALRSLSQDAGIPEHDISPDTDLTALYVDSAYDFDKYDDYLTSEYTYDLGYSYGKLRIMYHDKNNIAKKIICHIGWDSDFKFVLNTESGVQMSPLQYQTPGLTGAIGLIDINETVEYSVFQVNEGELFFMLSSPASDWWAYVANEIVGWPTAINPPYNLDGKGVSIPTTGSTMNVRYSNISDCLAIAVDPRGPTAVWIFFADTNGTINAVTNAHSDFAYVNVTDEIWYNNNNFTTSNFDQLYTNIGPLDLYYGMSVAVDPVEEYMCLTWLDLAGTMYWITWNSSETPAKYKDVHHQRLSAVSGNLADIPKGATTGKKTDTKSGLSVGAQAGIAAGVSVAAALLFIMGTWIFKARTTIGRPKWMQRGWRDWKRLSG